MFPARTLRWLIVCILWLFACLPVMAAEEILSFESFLDVESNGDLLVTETIRVRAEGMQIRRGIFRDIPTTFEDAEGRIVRAAFDLVAATRDGEPETTRVERTVNVLRIYLGQQDVFLDHGVHTYQLTYRTDRQVRFFREQDEIYWNATGTEWEFPILSASTVVRLPQPQAAIDATAYTGPFGSRERNARWSISSDGRVVTFETTTSLDRREGLSVVVAVRKGVIAEPTAAQKSSWYLRDRLGSLIAACGTMLVFIYYLWAWFRVGRDPPKGVVVPRWDLPDGVSPALTHYVWNKGLRRQGFPALAASAVSLAVQGYLAFQDIGDTITFRRTAKPTSDRTFPVGEAALMHQLTEAGGTLTISKASGTKISALGAAFRRAMENEHRNVFYRSNTFWVILGIVLSAVTIMATMALGNIDSGAIASLVPMTFIGFTLTLAVINVGKRAGTGLAGKIQLTLLGFFIVNALVNFGFLAMSYVWSAVEQPILIGALASLSLLNVLFYILMGAPTPLGRRRTDEIAGLRHYLTVAEKDRMNMAGAPEMSPEHFETLLPYAMALGVEKPWTSAFDTWTAASVATGKAAADSYSPDWYSGDFDVGDTVFDRISEMTSSMSDSFTAALPAPKSSSSGFSVGGGFSGGGGGGGGGGGW